MRRTLFPVLALLAFLPAAAIAQDAADEELPRALFISQWICPQSIVGDIMQTYDSLTIPVEQELVNEGLLFGTGMFFHQWGDEWNVNWYRIGQDNAAVFDALPEVGRRVNERHPDAPSFLDECTAHKDNIYFWGPRTAPPPTP